MYLRIQSRIQNYSRFSYETATSMLRFKKRQVKETMQLQFCGAGNGTGRAVSFCCDQNRDQNRDLSLGSCSGSRYKKVSHMGWIHKFKKESE